MTAALRHRGPDDEGFFLYDTRTGRGRSASGKETASGLDLPPLESCDGPENLLLGFRRLSILDLSSHGHQPMWGANRTSVLMFNGEIYNYLELRKELEADGCRFETGTDTEVLLALLDRDGPDCLPRLVGMFAIAYLSLPSRTLLLARDFVGIKPLYYTFDESGCSFASEIKALRSLPGFAPRINPSRAIDFLVESVTDYGGETLFAGVHQVPPAHWLHIRLDPFRPSDAVPHSFWHPPGETDSTWTEKTAAERFRELFSESVGLHLRSDVPVGAALSGGLDSSSIVVEKRRLAPETPLHTFSYLSSDPERNEGRWADLVNQAVHGISHPIRIGGSEALDEIPALIDSQDEPFGGLSILAQRFVFREVGRAGIKVMLDGQGADEVLGGYPDAKLAALTGNLAGEHWGRAFLLFAAIRRSRNFPDKQVFATVRRHFKPQRWPGGERPAPFPPWLREEWFLERNLGLRLHQPPHHPDALRKNFERSLVRTSLPMLLRFADRNSMAFSIEGRFPFLVPKLVEFLLSLPANLVLDRRAVSKKVLRNGMRGRVPDAILDRTDKIGFEAPDLHWFFENPAWVDARFAGEAFRRVPLWRIGELSAIREKIRAGRGTRQESQLLWRWINFALWAERTGIDFN